MKKLMKIVVIIGILGFYTYAIYECPRDALWIFGLWYGGIVYAYGCHRGYKNREKEEHD